MDDYTPKWTKVAEDSSQGPQKLNKNIAVVSNWVRSRNGYCDIDKFCNLYVFNMNRSSYGRTDDNWQVVGITINGFQVVLKEYKKKENAYEWLNKVMEGFK